MRPAWLALIFAVGCSRAAEPAVAPLPASPSPAPAAGGEAAPDLAALRAFERRAHEVTDFANQPPWTSTTGANPIAILALGDGRAVGLLRGASALVLLDAQLHQLARLPAPASPTGLARADDGTIWVSGEESPELAHYRVTADGLERIGELTVGDALAIRDLAAGPGGALYLIEEHQGRLLSVIEGSVTEIGRCHGPTSVERVASDLIVNCLLDHAVEVRALGADGVPSSALRARIHHDGPIWAVDGVADALALWLALGGIEDRPLDRGDGSFGYIDSFVFLYRVDAAGPTRVAEVNTSSLGVVTTKAVALERSADTTTLLAAGYGGEQLAELTWRGAPSGAPSVRTFGVLPGVAALARAGGGVLAANPLLDAWLAVSPAGTPRLRALADPDPRPIEAQVGEALFFTTLMAPYNPSEGHLSRFTCEACHYEGYVDGRVHYTGRGEVHAATRPLLGLGNNRPHFSRALDRSMTKMVHNEFRVANKASGRDPWFSLPRSAFPWLARMGDVPAELSPVYLRRSLMAFLYAFAHRPNPAAQGRSALSDTERRGAQVFRSRCERCHQARLVADEPTSRQPFERWESLVLSVSGPVVWASEAYAMTGVTPYVHERGARVPPLRRLYKKWPYLTNGSATSLDALLASLAWRGDAFFHAAAPDAAARLEPGAQAALAAFLALL